MDFDFDIDFLKLKNYNNNIDINIDIDINNEIEILNQLINDKTKQETKQETEVEIETKTKIKTNKKTNLIITNKLFENYKYNKDNYLKRYKNETEYINYRIKNNKSATKCRLKRRMMRWLAKAADYNTKNAINNAT